MSNKITMAIFHYGRNRVNEKIEENVQDVVGKAEQEVTRSSVPWYRASKRAYVLIGIYAVQLALFALLAWFVHVHPVIAIDVTITREFQENQAPWLSYHYVCSELAGLPSIALCPCSFW